MNDSAPRTQPSSRSFPRVARSGMTLATIALVVGLAGCATGPRLLRTDVTTFNDWSALPATRTYAFSRTLEFQDSLEVKAYEDIVGQELATQGFTRVGEAAQANLLVTLRPTVTSTRLRVRDPWPDPFYNGFYGGFGGGFGGYYGGAYGWRGAGWGPGWDPYGGLAGSYAIDLYQRRLEMDIDSRAQPGRRYYEGKVENSGESDSMLAVMPYLVRALFADFPGNNGQTRRVDVQLPPRSPQ